MHLVDSNGSLLSSLTLKRATIQAAEEAGIALADLGYITILTYSQLECHFYQMGRITAVALKIFTDQLPIMPGIHAVWTPSHTSLSRNKAVHASARTLMGILGSC